MRKKYYIRKKRKLVSSYKILSIIVCILLLIAVGYSVSTTTLTIIARVNLEKETDIDLPNEKSKSSATWEIKTAPWGDDFTSYNIYFILENKDESVDTWTISMDFPSCVIEEDIEVWGASAYEVERIGNYDRITFHPMDWNAQLDLGDTLEQLGFNIKLSGKTNMKIEHLIFNNRLVTDFKQIGTIYNVVGEEDDKNNKINQNTTINETTQNTTTGNTTTNETSKNTTTENTTTNETSQNTTTENTITNETGGGTIEGENSKATWNIVHSWGTTHQVKVEVENNYKACSEWTIVIDVPQGIDESSITSWASSSVKVERIGNYDRITFKSQSYNGNVGLGEKASLEFQINYPETTDFKIYKVIFNGKEITEISKTK